MNVICISGWCLCGDKINGFSRAAVELLKAIDQLLCTYNYGIEVQLCYPEQKELLYNCFRKIKVVKLVSGSRNTEFHLNALRKHANECKGVYVGLAQNICVTKHQVSWIHDIRPLDVRGFDTRFGRLYHRAIMNSSIVFKPYIVTQSEYCKESIIRIWGKRFENRITVAGSGWDHMQSIDEDDTIFYTQPMINKGEYYYSLGSVMKHKNYEWIYKAAKFNPDAQFVVAGSHVNCDFEQDNKASNILYVGYVSDEENKALMKHCRAYIHPAKYEGFGLPPLEALSLGKEIIISNATCLPGIYGNTAHYMDPYDPKVSIGDLLSTPVESPQKLLEKYTWENVAHVWLDLFAHVCENG